MIHWKLYSGARDPVLLDEQSVESEAMNKPGSVVRILNEFSAFRDSVAGKYPQEIP